MEGGRERGTRGEGKSAWQQRGKPSIKNRPTRLSLGVITNDLSFPSYHMHPLSLSLAFLDEPKCLDSGQSLTSVSIRSSVNSFPSPVHPHQHHGKTNSNMPQAVSDGRFEKRWRSINPTLTFHEIAAVDNGFVRMFDLNIEACERRKRGRWSIIDTSES